MFRVIIKGPNNTQAVLNPEQFQAVRHIIVKMMNNGMTRARAHITIAERLAEVGLPLQFVERSNKHAD
jgi:hypothetical protein